MEAPYLDPDGYPSWQPNPLTREGDAIARRWRETNYQLKDIKFLIDATRMTLVHLQAQELELEQKLSAITEESDNHRLKRLASQEA